MTSEERKIRIRVIMAAVYGVVTILLGFITAGCVDGTVAVATTGNVALAGILFGILAIIEIEKAVKLANEM